MIGHGTSIADTAEFNRRAAIALRGVSFTLYSSAERVVKEFQRQQAAAVVSDKMQQAIYSICVRYRRQITDKLVVDYASDRAKGSE